MPSFFIDNYKTYFFVNRKALDCYFLVSEQESNQRSRPKGRYENAPPLETPAASPSDTRKCPDFRVSATNKLATL